MLFTATSTEIVNPGSLMPDQKPPIASSVPSLVLFDLDDTLCDHYTSLRLRLRLAFEAALDSSYDVDVAALVEEAAAHSVGGTNHFADLLARHGVLDAERCKIAIDHYASDRFRGLELFEESLDVVRHIRQFARVGMITNGPSRIQRDKIDRLAIADLFEVILVSEEEGVWKPDPLIFTRALDRFGVRPHAATFVGDSPEHDIAGAQAAGISSVWINRRGRGWPGGARADREISSLTELPSLLGLPHARAASTTT